MITLEEAELILGSIHVEPIVEEGFIHEALGRILAQDIESQIEMPPFDKSAMDGYALSSSDRSKQFKVVDTIAAGMVPTRQLKEGECAKIMTGGAVPHGADRVVKIEVTAEEKGIMIITGEDSSRNICFRAEDVAIGDIVLKKGAKIRPQEIGVIASMGLSKLNLYRRPLVGIIATGSELADPGVPLKPTMIYDSNSYALAAQVTTMGALAHRAGIILDSREGIQAGIEGLLETCDLVLISGGVSMGDFDYVPSILEKLGFRLHIENVAVKPGKPTVFATRDHSMVFGVPGNPVSTFVIFEILIKPFLYRIMGHEFQPHVIPCTIDSGLKQKKAKRSAFFPVRCNRGSATLLTYHGSAHIHALSLANGLVCLPRGEKEIPAGSIVNVRSIC